MQRIESVNGGSGHGFSFGIAAKGARVYYTATDERGNVALSVFRLMDTFLVLRDTQKYTTGLNSGAATAIAVSPDGEMIYIIGPSTITVFRQLGSDKLTFVERIELPFKNPSAIAVNPVKPHVYVAGGSAGDHLAVFKRNGNFPCEGAGCTRADGTKISNLELLEVHTDGQGGVDLLRGASSIAVSPDGQNVYVAASQDNAIQSFFVDN